MQILLSRAQARPGRAVKQEQDEISPNNVQALKPISVLQLYHGYELGTRVTARGSCKISRQNEEEGGGVARGSWPVAIEGLKLHHQGLHRVVS